jgi:pimeloyl-ACP methyl ester carboxylesterase
MQQARHVRRSVAPDWGVEGRLVAFAAEQAGKVRMLDGFYRPAPEAGASLLAFVHGMGSNFYRSALKKAFLEAAPETGLAALSFNNRGAERGTEDEPFGECLADLDAAAAFGRRMGHRRLVFVGHSTGCQKIAYWQARRARRDVAGLVLLAPADDYAVSRRDLGTRFDKKVAWAKAQVARGRGDAQVSGLYERFCAARFLSVASVRSAEANVFRYDGPLTQFRRVRCPILAVFGAEEEFAAIEPARMLAILRRKTKSADYSDWLLPGAGHSFKGCEASLAAEVCAWAREKAT